MKILPSWEAIAVTIGTLIGSCILALTFLSLSKQQWINLGFFSLFVFVILCIARIVDLFFEYKRKYSRTRIVPSQPDDAPIDFSGY